MTRRAGESGIALLIVLLTITLLTIVVIEFTDTAQIETHLALSARNALQASYLARSGVNLAEAWLLADRSPPTLQSRWAQPIPPVPVGDGTATFRIRDESRFLNLNGLRVGSTINNDRRKVVTNLFVQLQLDPRIVSAICDWLDADNEPFPDPPGAEQSDYLSFELPTIVRNDQLLTFRELMLVRGITPSILAKLEDLVTVLPSNDFHVNINTAPPQVLAAVLGSARDGARVVDQLVSARENEPFKSLSLDDLPELGRALGPINLSDWFTTVSTYYRIEAVGEINDVRRGIVEIVSRNGKNLQRIRWTPTATTLALTSQPPSDFLSTLPVLGDR